ncbi:MAG: diguanylate cyclase [Leptolyngbya sp.]|nr:diguanylate cyclase [Leptolyngbya sp.]
MAAFKVLIVEDELLIARDLSQTLKRQGFHVTKIVSSAQAALDAIEAEAPDIVLMDIVIKGEKDGIDAASIIYQRYHLPVLYLTAYADEETLNRVEQSQAYGYLLKPFKVKELSTTIRIAISKHQQVEQLEWQRCRDGLTGLFNRIYLEEAIVQHFQQAERYNWPVSLIFIDIDHFKRFNDTYGHDAGDYVIKSVGYLLQHSVRQVDLVVRYGGEEIIVLLPNCSVNKAAEIADNLRLKVSSLQLHFANQDLNSVTISLGVASFPLQASDSLNLIKAADEALYKAKQNGRNQVVVADSSSP